MAELPMGGARHWVEFPDPAGSAGGPQVTYRCDLTWLTSTWRCIFGSGCRGIIAGRPDDGCCTLGAHFTDEADLLRVQAAAAQLDRRTWQFARHAASGGVTVSTPDDAQQTRLVSGACIFLNRPGFPTGAGCALHQLAQRTGQPIVQTKPEVCWQLPIRRSYEDVTDPDESSRQVVVIAEFDRRGWGPGGHDLDWYCTTDTEAHTGDTPLFLSAKVELVELLGQAAYEVLASHCRARVAAIAGLRRDHPELLAGMAPHPAARDRPAP